MRPRHATTAFTLFAVLVLGACRQQETAPPPTTTTQATATTDTGTPEPPITRVEATPEAIEQARQDLQAAADRDRRMRACLTFEDFEATVYKEPFEGGKYIVNGDTPIANRKQLREFYEQNVKPRQNVRLIVDQISGIDNKWNHETKRQLKYCVSTAFGSRHAAMVQQMANATAEWEKVAAVDFIHDASQDANCGPGNAAVVFDIRPVNVNGEYLARAFFPNEPRAARNVLVDDTSFELTPSGKLQLVGILRHELGHTLGFRHEHTRPDSGSCFEDRNWRPLTSYDAFSVMHYPQCNGRGDWSLNLTVKDKNGVACLYGPTPPFTIDAAQVDRIADCLVTQPTVAPAQPRTETFAAQTVDEGAQRSYGPFAVTPGTIIDANIGGAGASGDPDLYLRFNDAAGVRAFDCRPFLDGPTEACRLTVPQDARQAFVMVRGFAAGTYELRVTHTPSAPGAVAEGGGQPAP